jgi:ribosome-associated translation inhibitor RaiA
LEIAGMDGDRVEAAIENIDARLARVEQILPTLATREELREAIAPLATREEMHAAIQSALASAVAPLATREELYAAIQAAIAPLATRAEMYTAIREEGERSRRHTDILIEDVRDDNRLILEHLIVLSARVDALAQR